MITIAIDEYGDFNFLKPNSKNTDNKKNMLYISGIVYNDLDDSQDANFERQRLDRFFRVIADKENVSYPEAFYSKRKGEVSETDSDDLPTETMYLNMLDSEEENSEENPYAAKKTVYISEKAKYKRAIAAALSEFFAHGTYNGEDFILLQLCSRVKKAKVCLMMNKQVYFHMMIQLVICIGTWLMLQYLD